MVMKGKGGQFYLVAAIVIITILIGFSVVSNYSRNKEVVQLYDLKQELNIETTRVLEYGTYQEEDAETVLSDFAQSYADYAGQGKNMYFFYGNFQNVTAVAYQDLSSDEIKMLFKGGTGGKDTISCTLDDDPTPTTPCQGSLGNPGGEMIQGEKITFGNFVKGGVLQDRVRLTITLSGEDYVFRLKTGENFYFVLEQKVGGERYVVSG